MGHDDVFLQSTSILLGIDRAFVMLWSIPTMMIYDDVGDDDDDDDDDGSMRQ